MPVLADRQASFAGALLNSAGAEPGDLRVPTGAMASRRFAIYRNNVAAGLIQALRDAFPAVARILGYECFAALALAFARANPPFTPVMLEYGTGFPSFLQEHDLSIELPYLADVARIEHAWVEAFHARDAVSLDGADLLDLDAEKLRLLQLRPHPSLRIVRSAYRALTIWAMNVGRRALAPTDFAGSENALVLRADAEISIEPLSDGAAELLASILAGHLLCDALAHGVAADPAFNPAGDLGRLIEVGAFTGWEDVRGAGGQAGRLT